MIPPFALSMSKVNGGFSTAHKHRLVITVRLIMNLIDYLNTRMGLTSRHRRVMDRPVPGWINYFYCFGGITFALFIVQLLTGLLLSTHYNPSEADAYTSI